MSDKPAGSGLLLGGKLSPEREAKMREEDEARAQLRAALRRLRRLFKTTGNPLYAWEALNVTSWRDGERDEWTPVPRWVLTYLRTTASRLCDEAKACTDYARSYPPALREEFGIPDGPQRRKEPKQALAAVTSALGLTRRGWSAFRDYASRENAIHTQWLQTHMRFIDKAGPNEIHEAIRSAAGLNDKKKGNKKGDGEGEDRHIRRVLATGRKAVNIGET